jgi:nucleotide-binding universal stress UspA family protein
MAARVGPVVVGTDFSAAAAAALYEGRRLAQQLGAVVEVVHVVDGGPPRGWGESGQAGRWLKEAALEPSALVVRYGSPWIELSRYAGEAHPSALVVGVHGRSGYQPLSLGSTATRVSLHARCPVLLVPARTSSGEEEVAHAGRTGAAAGVRQEPAQSQSSEEQRDDA